MNGFLTAYFGGNLGCPSGTIILLYTRDTYAPCQLYRCIALLSLLIIIIDSTEMLTTNASFDKYP